MGGLRQPQGQASTHPRDLPHHPCQHPSPRDPSQYEIFWKGGCYSLQAGQVGSALLCPQLFLTVPLTELL
jgi:hypothetical protein